MSQTLMLQRGEVALFGYASLLLKSSMERTLGRPYDRERYGCHLSGWRRTWNCFYPNQRYYYTGADGERVYPESILYLNISRAAATLNGLVYVVREEDLPSFDKREAVYDRVDVREQLTDLKVEGGPVLAYVGMPNYLLSCPVPARQAAIRRVYVALVEAGLAELGPEFTSEYRLTTDDPPEASIVDDQFE